MPLDCGRSYACGFCTGVSECLHDKKAHDAQLLQRRLRDIHTVIMVLANKGGVGKSTVSAQLAARLADRGHSVGLADMDVHGPNAAALLGGHGQRIRVEKAGIAPYVARASAQGPGLKVASMDFFLESGDTPVIWRDSYKHDYVQHAIGSFNWGRLDFLVLDMPPGTGSELISVCDLFKKRRLFGLIVTTPDALSILDTRKAARFCRERGVPLLGVVENKVSLACPHCGHAIEVHAGQRVDAAYEDLPVVARLPLSLDLAGCCDRGETAGWAPTETGLAEEIRKIVDAAEMAGVLPGVVSEGSPTSETLA